MAIIDEGQPVAVAVSIEHYEELEAMKLEVLQLRFNNLKVEEERGELLDASSAMASLYSATGSDQGNP